MAFVFVVPLVFVMGGVIGAFRAFVVAGGFRVLVMGGVTRVFVMGGVIRGFVMDGVVRVVVVGGVVRRQAGMPFGVLVLRLPVGGVMVHVQPILACSGPIWSGCDP